MSRFLEGKTACVMAASKGLGRASATALARAGANLVLMSRNAESLEHTSDQIRQEFGAKVIAVPGDVAKLSDIQRCVNTATEVFGRLDVLVTNAGGPPAGSFENLSDEMWYGAIDLTLMSAVRMIRAALPALKVHGGSIINIQSTSIKQPIPDLTLSNSIRAAVHGLSKDLAISLAPFGIRVNVVAPGRIDTDRVRGQDQARSEQTGLPVSEVKRQSEASIPLGRYGHPEELGSVVAFLASEAASYVTGQTLFVDGGLLRSL